MSEVDWERVGDDCNEVLRSYPTQLIKGGKSRYQDERITIERDYGLFRPTMCVTLNHAAGPAPAVSLFYLEQWRPRTDEPHRPGRWVRYVRALADKARAETAEYLQRLAAPIDDSDLFPEREYADEGGEKELA